MTATAARARRTLALLLVGILATLVGACGLSANSEPQVIASGDLPPELLAVNPSSSTTLAASPATTSATVYFLTRQDGVTRLVPVQREVADATRPGDRLIALLGAPTAEEAAAGIITSIPSDTVLLDTELDDATDELKIELSRSLFDIQGEELRNAFAQLVWTATDLEGIQRVTFVIDGQAYRVPDDAGIEQPGPVSRTNYRSLAPVG